MSDDAALHALGEAFADDDAASAAWSQTAPEIKARCIAYVAAADGESERRTRARDVHRLAAAGTIHEHGPGLPELPLYLRNAWLGLL